MPAQGISNHERKSTESFIKENSGNTSAFEKNDIAYKNSQEVENASARADMVSEISKDDSKGGTSDENNREYGGVVSTDDKVTPSPPGAVSTPTNGATIEQTILENTKATFHGHPSGTLVETSPGVIKDTEVSKYEQAPSQPDLNRSGGRTNYTFGRRDETTYIYNSKGVVATIPTKYFVTPKKEK